MSVQGTKLAGIAAAIREKEGSNAPICANDFAARIRALQTGGGGGSAACGVEVVGNLYPDKVVYVGELLCPAMETIGHSAQYEVVEGMV